jgi:hypothetical protein
MKKVLLALVVLGALSFSSCKKDELVKPKVTKVADGGGSKEVCHECGGSWD